MSGVRTPNLAASVFERRRTAVPAGTPPALTSAFAGDPAKATQWEAFLGRNGLDVGGVELAQIIAELARFLVPPLGEIREGGEFRRAWPAGGPWSEAECY